MNVSFYCTPHFLEVIVSQTLEVTILQWSPCSILTTSQVSPMTQENLSTNISMNAWNTDEVLCLDESGVNIEAACSK